MDDHLYQVAKGLDDGNFNESLVIIIRSLKVLAVDFGAVLSVQVPEPAYDRHA